MPSGPSERYDFFLSRRGSVAAIAQEVEHVLAEKGYNVCTQDYDMPLGSSFVEGMHEGIKNSRDLIILFTRDYEQSRYTREEFASFAAQRLQDPDRHVVILRCEDAPLEGLLADKVYQDLVGVDDPEQRKLRIIAAAERQSQAAPPPPRPFIGVPPRIASFTGRSGELDRLDAILMQDKPAAVTQASVGRAAVQGLGGVGKTSLAIEYAHRFRGLYAGVCWCPAETHTGLLSALASLAVTLGAAAEALMAYLAQCAPERIPMTLVEGAIDEEAERLEALSALTEVSLVKHDPFEDGTPAVTVHRLVQAVARARSEANGTAQGAVERLIARLVATYPKEAYRYPQSWPLCAKLTPHLLARRGPDDASVSDLLSRAGSYFHRRAAYVQGAPLLRDALAVREKALGPEHPDTATSLSSLASLLDDQGDLAGARPLFERALAIREKALGPEHPDTAMSLNYLAMLLRKQGDFAGARPLIERALAISEKSVGPQHPITAMSLDSLASLLRAMGDLAGARSLYERALAISEKALGPEHFNTATSLNNLALLLQDQGDLAGARPLFERALAICEKALGPEHPDTAVSLNSLASLLRYERDLAGARPLYERALAITEKALGPEHSDTAMSLNNLAMLLIDQDDLAAARPLCERALAIREKALGPEHPKTSFVRCNLSRLRLLMGRPTEALTLCETALTANDKVLGRDHAWTKGSARVTADALDALGRAEEAKALRERYGVTEPEKPKVP